MVDLESIPRDDRMRMWRRMIMMIIFVVLWVMIFCWLRPSYRTIYDLGIM